MSHSFLAHFGGWCRYGDIGDVYIPRDHRSNESRGFAFVRYYREKDADYAIEEMDGRVRPLARCIVRHIGDC